MNQESVPTEETQNDDSQPDEETQNDDSQPDEVELQSFRTPVVVDSLVSLLDEAENLHGLSATTTVFCKEGELYLKAGTRPLLREEQRVLYIARICLDEEHRSKGLFTNLLKQAERCAAMYRYGLIVESVLNPRLEKFLLRNGFREMDFSSPPTFFKTKHMLLGEFAELRRRLLTGAIE